MKTAGALNPADFVVVPHVCCLDEFVMRDDTGGFVATINEPYIDRFVDHMNGREANTGDLAPLVIGHTTDGTPETEQPPVVGFARHWVKAPWTNSDGKRVTAAFFDAWIYKQDVDEVRKFPRRSAEIWPGRYEADPISLLGATTPCRDLGLMRLSRDGSMTYYSPGDMTMPDDDKGKPKAEPKESGANAELKGLLEQVLAAVTKLADSAAAKPADGAAAPAGAAAGAAGADGGEMSDAELEELLKQMDGGQGGAAPAPAAEPAPDRGKGGEKPVKEGYDGEAEKMQRQKDREELSNLRSEVARMQIEKALAGYEMDDKEGAISDLAAQPPDMRLRGIDRLKKLARKTDARTFHLEAAVSGAVSNSGAGIKRITTREEQQRIVKLSRDKNISFEEAARQEGYQSVG